MTQSVTFSEEVKEELCKNEYQAKYSKFLLYSFFSNTMVIHLKKNKIWWTINTNYGHVIRLIKKLLKQQNESFNFSILKSESHKLKKTVYQMYIDNHLEEITKILSLEQFEPNKCNHTTAKKYFVIGAFLSGGSISFSKTKSNYHFEIRSNNLNYLEILQQFILDFNIESKIINFRNQYKLYIKKVGLVSDMLKIMNSSVCMYKLEDYRIQKDFVNSLQRLNNLEVANIKKTVSAASNQKLWITTILEHKDKVILSKKEKIFIEFRLKYPNFSLSELSDEINKKYDLNISRTSLNHIVRNIHKKYCLINPKDSKIR